MDTTVAARSSRRPGPRVIALVVTLALAAGLIVENLGASAGVTTWGGWRATASVSPSVVSAGAPATITVTVKPTTTRTVTIAMEVTGPSGTVRFTSWPNQKLTGGKTRTLFDRWNVPAGARGGVYVVRVAIYSSTTRALLMPTSAMAAFTVTNTSDTTAPPATAPPTTAAPVTTPPTVPPTTAPPVTAPPTTAPPTTAPPTTAPPATTPPTTAPPATTPTVPSTDFLLDFTGPNALDTIRRGVYHRNIALGYSAGHEFNKTWQADHDMTCGAPTTTRTLDGTHDENDVFACKDHVMTSMGDVDGYSLTWFSPKQTFTNTSKVCWDVNLTNLGTRTWWEVAVVPVATSELIADDWLVELSPGVPGPAGPITPYSKANGVIAAWGPFDHKLAINDDRDSVDYTAGTDKATRYHHCLTDNGNGTVTFTQARGDGTVRSFTSKRSFPKGETKIVFKQHSYTPDKDGPVNGYTFHWDNIQVTGTQVVKSGALLRNTLLNPVSRQEETASLSYNLLCQLKIS